VYPRAPINATFFRACVVSIRTGASASVAYPALASAAKERADVENARARSAPPARCGGAEGPTGM
jgi:hypothetical protein